MSLSVELDKPRLIHKMKYYLTINKELLIHTATWTNLKDIMSCEKIQCQKVTFHMIPFI